MLGQLRGAETSDHRLKQRRRDCQIVRRPPGVAQCLFKSCEGIWGLIVSTYILEERQEVFERALVIHSARSLDAVRDPLVQALHTQLREGDADYGNFERASLDHRIKCREDHLMGQVARHPEEHQRVRMGLGHHAPTLPAAAMLAPIQSSPVMPISMWFPFRSRAAAPTPRRCWIHPPTRVASGALTLSSLRW